MRFIEGFVVEVRGFVFRALADPVHRNLNRELHILSALLDRCEDRDSSVIKVGTICSGIGTQEMVGDCFNMLWKSMRDESPLEACWLGPATKVMNHSKWS